MSDEKSIPDIVHEWLKANGYDGLTNDEDCGCTLDDLLPCGGCICECFPAYNHGGSEPGAWSMSREKPEGKP